MEFKSVLVMLFSKVFYICLKSHNISNEFNSIYNISTTVLDHIVMKNHAKRVTR